MSSRREVYPMQIEEPMEELRKQRDFESQLKSIIGSINLKTLMLKSQFRIGK